MPAFEFETSDGVRLWYRREGSGPLVIALHGFPDTYRTWDGMSVSLVKAGYTVVTLAMRGYAPSGIPQNGNYAIDRLGRDVAELLVHLKSPRAIVLGHDWGASAAYALAASHPDRISALIALAIAPPAVTSRGLQERWARPHNWYLGFGAVSDWWLRRRDFREIDRLYALWSPSWQMSVAHRDRVRAALRPAERSRAAIDYYRLGKTGQSSPHLAVPIATRCLMIYGGDEPRIRKDAFQNALRVVADGSQVLELTGVGHWPHLEDPERCVSAITAFLRKNAEKPLSQSGE